MAAWKELEALAAGLKKTHLRDLLKDDARTKKLWRQTMGMTCDFSRQQVDTNVMDALLRLGNEAGLKQKIADMKSGQKINATEGRAVLHTALRAESGDGFDEGIIRDVCEVREDVFEFAEKVRSGNWLGHTGKKLTSIVSVGIGGSYLGVDFIFEALRTKYGFEDGRTMRFLANVDPIDVRRALSGLDPETTLVVIVSKTFTTAETMLNAQTMKNWLVEGMDDSCVSKHMVACSTALDKTSAFGITTVFKFWDWVGGRFSACASVGLLPLSLYFGKDVVCEFLNGAREMDKHFFETEFENNLPVLMALLAVWNLSFMGHEAYALLPYCQALHRFTAHVQQLDMESNGKRVKMNGEDIHYSTGGIYFGEPGTNGQHSFYQLLHQGTRVIPCEFLAFAKSQNEVHLKESNKSNHDELMSNFFAQPDALALGKTKEEVQAEGVPTELMAHKVFPGNRPSSSVLFDGDCDAAAVGKLLALYEHRTAVQGWIWGVNSFDQYGVELGKVLAKGVGKVLINGAFAEDDVNFLQPTKNMLQVYLDQRAPRA